MIDTQAVRALADELRKNWRVETADMLRQCADEIDALRGQALSDPERGEYFAMKEDAARYRWLRDKWFVAGFAFPWHEELLEPPANHRLDEAIDRARKGTT